MTWHESCLNLLEIMVFSGNIGDVQGFLGHYWSREEVLSKSMTWHMRGSNS